LVGQGAPHELTDFVCCSVCLCALAGWKCEQRARQDQAPLDQQEGAHKVETQREARLFAFSSLLF